MNKHTTMIALSIVLGLACVILAITSMQMGERVSLVIVGLASLYIGVSGIRLKRK